MRLSDTEITEWRGRLGFPEAVPVSGGGPPRGPAGVTTVSASRLQRWQECPAAYAYRYEQGGEDAPTNQMRRGKAAHAALEALGRAALLEKKLLTKAVVREAGDLALAAAGVVGADAVYIRDALETARGKLSFERTVGVEEPFRWLVDDFCVVGVFDRVDVVRVPSVPALGEPGGDYLDIVDYKTGQVVPTQAEAATNLQVRIYLAAARELTGHDRIRCTLWYVAKDRTVTTAWSPELHAATLADLRRLVAEIRAGGGRARTGDHCVNCAYAARCPARAAEVANPGTVAAAAADDAELLRGRQRASHLAKLFEDERKTYDGAIKRRLAERPILVAGGWRAKVVTKTQYREADLETVARELAPLAFPDEPGATPAEDAVREAIQGVDARRLKDWLATLPTEAKQACEERLDELREPYDSYSYVMVTEAPVSDGK